MADSTSSAAPTLTTLLTEMPEWDTLSTRLKTRLLNGDFVRVGDVLRHTEKMLIQQSQIGGKTLRELREWLASFGFAIPVSNDQIPPELRHWKAYWTPITSQTALSVEFDAWCEQKGIVTYGQLARLTEEEVLANFPGYRHVLYDLRPTLREVGLTFGMRFAWDHPQE